MENAILIVLIAAAVAVGVWQVLRRVQGKGGGCCGGGGSYTPKKKKLAHAVGKKTFRVEGMSCVRCQARVEEEVNDIQGVAGRADWKKGLLTVQYDHPVDDEVIRRKVERAGYHITGVL